MIYPLLKYLHVGCVALSGTGFFVRGLWMINDSPLLKRRWVRIVPHIVDTVLLGSAITMVVMSAQYPFAKGWLTAKLIGLVVYIICGMMALKRGRTRILRILFFAAALLAFAYIVSVALTRSPQGFLA